MKPLTILKAIGIFLGTFVLLLIAMFFAYPYLEPEKYEKMTTAASKSSAIEQSGYHSPRRMDLAPDMVTRSQDSLISSQGQEARPQDSLIRPEGQETRPQSPSTRLMDPVVQSMDSTTVEPMSLTQRPTGVTADTVAEEVASLRNLGYELIQVVDSLQGVIVSMQTRMKEQVVSAGVPKGQAVSGDTNEIDKNKLRENIKSLMNLDEEELAPIVKEMTNAELKLLYSVSGNIQREKLLRSLPPNRAAKLIQEIMI